MGSPLGPAPHNLFMEQNGKDRSRHQRYFTEIEYKKEVLTQVFSCEFCEIFKNTFFTEHLRATASERISLKNFIRKNSCYKKIC